MSSKDGAPVKYAIRNSSKESRTRQIRGPLFFATSYACIRRVFFFGFSGVVERLLFMREKIGVVALYLSVSFSAPNTII